MKKVVIYSDGACHGNPGPGGWAAVLIYGKYRREINGGVPATTNNRMELQASLEAFMLLKEPCAVEFHTDSEYLRQGITTWLRSWKQNGWRTKDKKSVKNADLWVLLDAQVARHIVTWSWVKGHAGDPENERCDVLANEGVAVIKKDYTPDQLKSALATFIASANPAPSPLLNLI